MPELMQSLYTGLDRKAILKASRIVATDFDISILYALNAYCLCHMISSFVGDLVGFEKFKSLFWLCLMF